MTKKLIEFTPVLAVGPELACVSLTLARYEEGSFSQWGLQVSGTKCDAFLVISPLIMKVVGELSIGTDAREPIYEPVLETMKGHFHDARPMGCFHSGPLTGLFPSSQFKMAWNCLRARKKKKRGEWETQTERVLRDLRNFGLPFIELNSYSEIRGRCN